MVTSEARAKERRLRAYRVQRYLWRVRCLGSCKQAGCRWHLVWLTDGQLDCDCPARDECQHLGAVRRRLEREGVLLRETGAWAKATCTTCGYAHPPRAWPCYPPLSEDARLQVGALE